jgi:6-phosphofructokinase
MGRNLMVVMSGGTTSVINATLAGIIRTAQNSDAVSGIFAGCPGIAGLLNEDIVELTDLSEKELELLYYTPASGFVGTARFRPMAPVEMQRLGDVICAHDIHYFVNIGGNGTIKQSKAISRHLGDHINVAAVPKTVDNDLGDKEVELMFYTPGFPSCANYWRHKVQIMNQENLGARSHDKVLIAQTFGRRTGFLAGCARLGDKERKLPLLILLPEDQKPLHTVFKAIEESIAEHDRAMIIMAEGYEVGDMQHYLDPSGQIMYGSSSTSSAQLLVNTCMARGIQARSFVPGPDQRSDILFALEDDLSRAYQVGAYAVNELTSGRRDFFASIARARNEMTYTSIDFAEIEDFSRTMPRKWIARDRFDVTDSYVHYLESICGSNTVPLHCRNGSPGFARPRKPNVRKKLPVFSLYHDIKPHSATRV